MSYPNASVNVEPNDVSKAAARNGKEDAGERELPTKHAKHTEGDGTEVGGRREGERQARETHEIHEKGRNWCTDYVLVARVL